MRAILGGPEAPGKGFSAAGTARPHQPALSFGPTAAGLPVGAPDAGLRPRAAVNERAVQVTWSCADAVVPVETVLGVVPRWGRAASAWSIDMQR
ncbi:hypothetical protein, partial [Streptacidiphilus griseoplanus]|uniref:hypothetical protein n=1 Tax=Peterkaempfera griseoplana TaxID=66896 RepID=UPI001C378BB7